MERPDVWIQRVRASGLFYFTGTFRMKELKAGLVSAAIILAVLFVIAPAMPDLGSGRDIDPYIIRWQTSSYNPATRPEGKNQYLTTATDTLGSVRGLRRDTTAIFEFQPYLSFDVKLNDGAGDSAAQTLLLYSANDNQFRKNIPVWGEFSLVDSLVVTNETLTTWIVTDSPVAIRKYAFIINRGNAANNKTAAVTTKITKGGTFYR